VTLFERVDPSRWKAFARPGRRFAPGDRLRFGAPAEGACLVAGLDATVEAKGEAGEVLIRFDLASPVLDEAIHAIGHMPLPPYIAGRRAEDAADRAATRRSSRRRRARSRRRPPACTSPKRCSHGSKRRESRRGP
jgi:S-adenosylmethionine:tRNA ribosyltransferase-isomerase